MNIKRYLGSAFALLVFIFFFDWLVHGVLLSSIYAKTPKLWRDASQMVAKMPFNLLIQIGLSAWLAFIFAKLFQKGGWQNGLRFGLYFGLLSAIQAAGIYYWLPISGELASMWFFANLIESLLGGALLGFVYHR